ncbi:MAG TPA: GntR family transcriptional regulator [Acidobacteriaceae bacterium]|jgi:GntR family transcriptional regulator|nr:GntR family transcriptional regulator [Acidobacteriaceae bacterium]
MLNTDPRLLRYQKLRDEFVVKIARQVWRAGEAIPGQEELAKSYGIAVGTVRKAVDLLVAEGLLERMQGRGTFVRRASFDGSLFRFFRFQEKSGERRIPISKILLREVVEAASPVAATLQMRNRSKAIHLLRLRSIDDEPVLVEDIWLPWDKFRNFATLEIDRIGDLLYPAYEEYCGQIVASASETLTVATVSCEDAGHLQLKAETPVVVIERVAFGYDRTPLEWRLSRGPATHFSYHVDIR